MMKDSISIRFYAIAFLCVFACHAWAAPQNASAPAPATNTGFRIAGTVVSKTDSHPLARARVTIGDVKDTRNFRSVVTADDGKYEFNGLPAGKYSLTGAKRGFITANYDQHDEYSTAIVTGAGLDTETLMLRLAPDAIIVGKILDEAGEPVRHATVMLYYNDHSSGVDAVHQFRSSQTNDLGEYEMTPLPPGTYFLSVSTKPWYAIHPQTEQSQPDHAPEPSPTVDRALDVAYPVTYYPDVPEADEAQPIPIKGGDHIEADIHLTPVPSLRVRFRVADNGQHGYFFPQIEQPAFDGSSFVQTEGGNLISPGVVELTGVPAGHYNLRFHGPGASTQMNGVDLSKDGEEIDGSHIEAASTIKLSIHMLGRYEQAAVRDLTVGLRADSRIFAGVKEVDPKGEAEIQQVFPGRYEVVVWGRDARYSVSRISTEGASVSGHTLNVPAGANLSVSLTVATGSAEIEGKVTKSGKGFAGAMVVLVPKDAELDRDLFRRDQSDLDGTFVMHAVVPGSYTLLAIDNGWDLDWSQPGVIAAYAKHGQKVEVGENGKQTMNIPEAIEVQSK
jgi:uncharacterized surface anchored protein